MKKQCFNVSFRDIAKLCVSVLRHNTIYHIMNLVIWLFLSILPLLIGFIIKNLFNSLNLAGMKEYFSNLALLIVLLLCNVYFTYQGGLFDTKSRFYIGKLLRVNLFEYFTSISTEFSNAALLNMFNTDVEVIEEFISFTMDFFNKLVYFIFAFYILSSISFLMTIYVFTPLLIASFTIYICGEKIKNHYFWAKSEDIGTINVISSIIKWHSFIQYYDPEGGVLKFLKSALKNRKKKNFKKEMVFSGIEGFTEFFNNISTVIIMVSSLYLLNTQDKLGNFSLFIEYISYSAAYLLIFQEIFIKYKTIQKFLDNLMKQTRENSNNLFRILENKNCYSYIKLMPPLVFEDFALESTMKPIKFTLDQGEWLVITGKAGSGKTKFLNCLLNNTSYIGNIYSGKVKISEGDIPYANYVPQTTLLFDDTLINNIICYDVFNVERFRECLKMCHMEGRIFKDLIVSHKLIGKNGKSLSEGQRQRLAIARALYADNNILIMDHCLSNIDWETREEIIDNLVRKKMTVIIVEEDLELLQGKIEFKNLKIDEKECKFI